MRVKRISAAALALKKKGYESNGCGPKGTRTIFLLLFTYPFSFDLSEECEAHDLEYGLSRTEKDMQKKLKADENFLLNLEDEMKRFPAKLSPWRKYAYDNVLPYRLAVNYAIKNLPRIYYAIAMVGGGRYYWN